ncbi:MAG: hypothetical protein JNK15_17745 [Planctomycetes bacterium]|nr:hypothetical protein [Planctomycetota bacterium]
MSEALARAILRLLAIAICVFGVIRLSLGCYALLAMPSAGSWEGLGQFVAVDGMARDLQVRVVYGDVLIVAIGALLLSVAPGLSRYVVR